MFLIGLCVCVTGCLENGIARLVARRIVSHDDAAADGANLLPIVRRYHHCAAAGFTVFALRLHRHHHLSPSWLLLS